MAAMTIRGRRRRPLLAPLLGVLGLVAAGCATGPTPAAWTAPAFSPGRTAIPAATVARSPVPATPAVTPAGAIGLELVADGLESPLFVADPGDGSGRLFVLEQAGRVRVIRDGRLVERPYLDISARVASGGERGLLGLAFSPAFADDGLSYLDYTDANGDTVVSEVAAICCYLADAYPKAGLAPAVADKLRGPYLKWLFFVPSCVEPAVQAL